MNNGIKTQGKKTPNNTGNKLEVEIVVIMFKSYCCK